ncbi:threonine/serine ThrE exporter family protein [Actinomycetota bacterium]
MTAGPSGDAEPRREQVDGDAGASAPGVKRATSAGADDAKEGTAANGAPATGAGSGTKPTPRRRPPRPMPVRGPHPAVPALQRKRPKPAEGTTTPPAKRKVMGPSSPLSSGRFLQGDAPTEPIPLRDLLRHTPYRNPHARNEARDEQAARDALDLALRVGELMFRCGAGAPQVEASVIAVAESAGLHRLELDITNQSLVAQCSTDSGRRITLVRVVRSSRRDFARLTAVHDFVDSLVDGGYEPETAKRRLREITRAPRVWPKWGEMGSLAVLAGAVAALLGGGGVAIALATIAAIIVLVAGDRLSARFPEFYLNAVGGAIAVFVAWLGLWAGSSGLVGFTDADFAYVVAGGIVVLLPGRTMVSAFEDVLNGFPITGSGRMFAVFMGVTGIIIGVGGGLTASLMLTEFSHLQLAPPDVLELRAMNAPLVPAVIGSFVTGLVGAISLQSRRRLILPAALLALVAMVVLLGTGRVGLGVITGTGIAGVVIGFLGRLVALRLGAPAMVLTHPATYTLLPGLAIFRGLYDMAINGRADSGALSIQTGITTLLGAMATLLAIAAGVTLGEILAAPFDHRIVQARRRRRR